MAGRPFGTATAERADPLLTVAALPTISSWEAATFAPMTSRVRSQNGQQEDLSVCSAASIRRRVAAARSLSDVTTAFAARRSNDCSDR